MLFRSMQLCKIGQIQNCCHPNALMTLQEYLEDYAHPDTKEVGEALIKREIENVTNPKVKEIAIANLDAIKNGKRDFRF